VVSGARALAGANVATVSVLSMEVVPETVFPPESLRVNDTVLGTTA
jgi:hypothetical protein